MKRTLTLTALTLVVAASGASAFDYHPEHEAIGASRQVSQTETLSTKGYVSSDATEVKVSGTNLKNGANEILGGYTNVNPSATPLIGADFH